MNITALKLELTTDPLSRGYLAMSDEQAAASLNEVNRPGPDRMVVEAYEILEATVPAEWAALDAANKQRYQTIVSAGRVNLAGSNTRSALAGMFGPGTTTRANVIALQAGPQISRATELGLGTVGDGHVASARALP